MYKAILQFTALKHIILFPPYFIPFVICVHCISQDVSRSFNKFYANNDLKKSDKQISQLLLFCSIQLVHEPSTVYTNESLTSIWRIYSEVHCEMCFRGAEKEIRFDLRATAPRIRFPFVIFPLLRIVKRERALSASFMRIIKVRAELLVTVLSILSLPYLRRII